MSVITVEIWINGSMLRGNFASEASANSWITETLAALLAERPPQVGDQIEIRRTS